MGTTAYNLLFMLFNSIKYWCGEIMQTFKLLSAL